MFFLSFHFFYLSLQVIYRLFFSCIYKLLLERRTGQLEYTQRHEYFIDTKYLVDISYPVHTKVILLLDIYKFFIHNLIFNTIVRVIRIQSVMHLFKISRPALASIGNVMQLLFNIYLVLPLAPKDLIDE